MSVDTYGINLDKHNLPFRFSNNYSITDTYIFEGDDKYLVFMEFDFCQFENPYGDNEIEYYISYFKSTMTMDILNGSSFHKIGKKTVMVL